jgi:hypothetical protein
LTIAIDLGTVVTASSTAVADAIIGGLMTDSAWPYPAYSDRRWLGGDTGPDHALAAVVRTLRATIHEAGEPVTADPESLLVALSHLAEIAERVDWAMLSLVGEARSHAVPWIAVGGALGVTKQAAQQRFAAYVRQALEQAQEPGPAQDLDQPNVSLSGSADAADK